MFLGVIVILVQTLVFCLLTSIYIGLATEHRGARRGPLTPASKFPSQEAGSRLDGAAKTRAALPSVERSHGGHRPAWLERSRFGCRLKSKLSVSPRSSPALVLVPAMAFAQGTVQQAAANNFEANKWLAASAGFAIGIAALGGTMGQSRAAAAALEASRATPAPPRASRRR